MLILLLILVKCTPRVTHSASEDQDPLSADRAKYADRVMLAIKGREKAPVDSVFENLKVLGGFPAENLVFAMVKWSEALGVSCDHCHVTGEWPSDQKPEKGIARKMVDLGEQVNTALREIKGLKSERPGVNCFTCHRGALKPARRKN